jgi:uncharacterized protein with NAD-binding domain and iron-sulfur cluster
LAQKVIILGGGVAGMSAAHELIERGFQVEIYEKQPFYVGGKARSVNVPNSDKEGRKPLPGEHGFRFFPGFYRHITDTMSRIPLNSKKSVADNLVPTERVMLARFDKPPIQNLVNFPRSLKELEVLLQAIATPDTGLTREDVYAFSGKLWQLMTSCEERRINEYERTAWWNFLDAGEYSAAFQQYFAGGITRTLVAAKPKEMSTKTGGDILMQLLFLMGDPDTHADQVLNGPTNEAWLFPWRDYLQEKGVVYHSGWKVKELKTQGDKIEGALVEGLDGTEQLVQADHFISALPVEVMASLISKDIIELDPSLAYLIELAKCTEWMSGIQFYLNEEVPLTKGHVLFTDSPWALTAISQLQFWDDFNIQEYGNGKIKTILSVDVSDWETPGLNGKKAEDCSTEEIKEEVWKQLKKSLQVNGNCLLDDSMLENWYLDADINFTNAKSANQEPLLVNKVNTWAWRPEAYTNIPNLFLAADYVRTNTDLATMEAANEAARRAVNSIILSSTEKVPFCKIWKMHEPALLRVLRWFDQRRYEKGTPWKKSIPPIIKAIHYISFYTQRLSRVKNIYK